MLQLVSPIWNRFTRLQQVIALSFLMVLFVPYAQVYNHYSEWEAKWEYDFIWSDIEGLAFYLILFWLWYIGTTSEKKWARILTRLGFSILGALIFLFVWMMFIAFPAQDFILSLGVFALPILIIIILLDWIFAHPKNDSTPNVEVLDDLNDW